MYQTQSFHPASPLLGRCEPSLPAISYYDPAWFEREQKLIWARNWIYVGRANDLPVMTMRRISVAGQNLILVKDQDGTITCFHNTCRHRGSELCSPPERRLASRMIVCPYHQWSYALSGKLVATPFVSLTEDFRKADHGLFPVHVREWNGFVFVCLADDPPDFAKAPDLGLAVYDNWPMRELVTGHAVVSELACNWKVFWENFNECLHCPGIHPELCDMVPVYKQGIMGHEEAADWTPATPMPARNLKPGAKTWTNSGQPCGPEFPRLTDAERNAGYLFVTLLPTMFIVAHVDYVRAVSLRPLGPETTELKAEWLFPEETLKAPGFDMSDVVDFASTVIRQDGEACELNQRGLRSSKFTHGTLVPQEYAIFQVHEWIRRQLEEAGT
jgi:Rieske 2Fe-2S family protein